MNKSRTSGIARRRLASIFAAATLVLTPASAIAAPIDNTIVETEETAAPPSTDPAAPSAPAVGETVTEGESTPSPTPAPDAPKAIAPEEPATPEPLEETDVVEPLQEETADPASDSLVATLTSTDG